MSGERRPSGTVTFLFTDIEGSTRRWETDPDAMRVALAAHDDVLRTAIEAHGGWLFKHTGDGVLAAFASAPDAIAAAIEAQQALELPVRMGIGTGSAEQRGDDYFGPPLNAAARVMAAGHGGQILVAPSTAGLLNGVELLDLGEHSLRDLSGLHRLFQVRAPGLRETFPPLRTVDAVPGNLPVLATSFVGRDREVAELVGLVQANRLVTLTGVGGVGKTRLAVQVAGELVEEFPDGVWLVELAAVGDPAAVPDAVATVLGVSPQADVSMVEGVARAMSGRRALLVIDNCEHVLDAAAELIEAILARSSTVSVLATSREGLRVGAEQLWPVPSLGVGEGAASDAVELFVDRARAVNPGFVLGDDADAAAVAEICVRLDGIALAIELAAARMVSMSPTEIRDRLGDRFRLLAGGRRGLERHQTLRHAVAWSYDLLTDDERAVLRCCAVFVGGFDLADALAVAGDGWDEYALLDVVDALVRKSLLTTTRSSGQTRYGMLETIRQFAEDELAPSGNASEVRDRHARWFAEQAVAWWERWDGPGYDAATEWLEAEFANLRAGFRWAADAGDLTSATAIAAHTVLPAYCLNWLEPVGWAEELLPAATSARVPQLPRLYAAATICESFGRTEQAVAYAEAAARHATELGYDPFAAGWAGLLVAEAYLYDGQSQRGVEIATELATQPGFAGVIGRAMLTVYLPYVGRDADALALADEMLTGVRRHGNPFLLMYALMGTGIAFERTDPVRAMTAFRDALDVARAHRILSMQSAMNHAATLEAIHGDPEEALELFDRALDSLHRSGNLAHLNVTFARLALVFDGAAQPEVAATLYGITTTRPRAFDRSDGWIVKDEVLDHVRAALGSTRFDECMAAGAAMELGDAVAYARQQTSLSRTGAGQPGNDRRPPGTHDAIREVGKDNA